MHAFYSFLAFGRVRLQQKLSDQSLLNDHLKEEISELKQEASVIGEIPQRLCKSVANCKEIFKDILLTLQVKLMQYVCLFQFMYAIKFFR